ncbi:MAG: DUF2911 domain-containing protein [Cyclobacteriaceae bacterium]|nr:DUF2911 domain-containing protein [Cyclobacteriaceae bacterium]MCB0498454.1 DUF2911 domain-containing protein [Cyclobacteriaceae bacterium]MCB9236977.1 DUF2911 domain-containing protein [Flammeovirgaceae bacterium]MCW5901314.1 DUF2911 domain-containing protein [Cyclobacteriaceae bacterium]
MKPTPFFPFIIAVFLVGSVSQAGLAQYRLGDFVMPGTNSKAVVYQTIASTQMEITYSRPNMRGRKIFGNLVPYNKIWRTGADEATKLYFSTPVMMAGAPVDSGRYELFTIPGENLWQVILQKDRGQWGSYKYLPENDVARLAVTPRILDRPIETFTISVDSIGSNGGVLNISWGNRVVPVPITINLEDTVIPNLEKALRESSRPPYFQAAMFYYENNLDMDRASALMALALKRNPGHIGMLYRYALILKQKGDTEEAIEASEKSLKGAQGADPELKAEYVRLNTILLNELKSQKHQP